ncbi:hypothetical protein [Actinomadura sp. DC4]|nr:hypothetical protein [Actinomadura sp. DC4]MDN3352804.1 hypothetical protein [Actinomadura sp. DC4]
MSERSERAIKHSSLLTRPTKAAPVSERSERAIMYGSVLAGPIKETR